MNIVPAPVISVIIPVYNAEEYLHRCLDSVISQTFHDIEIICINDGSTDNSLTILQEYADKDSRISIINQKNCGVSCARNRGLDNARGTFISFVDCDDAVEKNIYETILEEYSDGMDAICFSAYEIDEYNSKKINTNSTYFNVKYSGFVTLHDKDILNISVTVWNKLFLRKNIEKISLRFPESICYEDNAFTINYLSIYRNVFFIKKHLYYYFRHENSIMDNTQKRKEGITFNYIKILDDIYSFYKVNLLFPSKQKLFERICIFIFRAALSNCNDWEVAGLAYELSLHLRKWQFLPEENSLRYLKEGVYNIRIGKFPGQDITMLKPLRGFQKIFYIGNCRNKRICCLFSIKIASWNRPV